MRKYLHCFFLLSFGLFVFSACKQEKDTLQTKITISSPQNKNQVIVISKSKDLNLGLTPVIEIELDSMGWGEKEMTIEEPFFAFYEIDENSYEVYLAPKSDLHIAFENNESTDKKRPFYSGKEAEINDYLYEFRALRDSLINKDSQYIHHLSFPDFIDRINLMESGFEEFHGRFPLTKDLSNLLKKKCQLFLTTVRQNYALIHYSELTKDDLGNKQILSFKKKVLFDSTLLQMGIYEQALALDFYLELEYNFPAWNGGTFKGIEQEIPLWIDSQINANHLPNAIEELLLAKNLYTSLRANGITPVTDSVFSLFKNNFGNSPYLESIEEKRQKWLSISPGRPAPDFTGYRTNGEPISLSDFRKKVVYVDVWATWCAPCKEEIPHSSKLQEIFKENDQIIFLNVSIDKNQEAWEMMVAENTEFKGLHMILKGEQLDSFYENYQIWGVPQYLLIDQEGKIVNIKAPRPSTGEELYQEIEKVLENQSI